MAHLFVCMPRVLTLWGSVVTLWLPSMLGLGLQGLG